MRAEVGVGAEVGMGGGNWGERELRAEVGEGAEAEVGAGIEEGGN